MKLFTRILPIILILCFALPLTAFADDDDLTSSETEETIDDTVSDTDNTDDSVSDTALDDIDTSGQSVFSEFLTELFGTYTPRTQTITETYSDGSTVSYSEIVPGLAGLDWSYIVAVVLFALSLYCVFRVIGGLIKWM